MSPKNSRWWRVVDWRTVLVAGLPMWALVIGVVVWEKLTPSPVVVQVVESPHSPPQQPPEPPERVGVPIAPEVLPHPRAAEEPARRLDPIVVNALADAGRDVWKAVFAGKGEGHPPREDVPPPVAEKQPVKIPDGCKTYDTAIHFVKNLETAQRRAKAESRLVFVLHLSGNIEDPGFT